MDVVIVKWATHPALDEVEAAFENELLKQNGKINIRKFNAEANPQNAAMLAEKAGQLNPKIIVAFATPTAQAVARASFDGVLLYAAVSDAEGAGLFKLHPKTTGIANVSPAIIDAGLDVLRKINPNLKTIGTIYNPAEQNSVYVQRILKEKCDAKGIALIQRQISDPTQISNLAEYLAPRVDAFYCANDNMVNLGIASISAVAQTNRKPFLIGEPDALNRGATFAIGVDYTETGRELASIANEVFKGQSMENLPPREALKHVFRINDEIVSKMELNLSDEIRQLANENATY